ncbi:hypothetical protein DH86_00004229 [Scytalidium sp. 3C]|nr:hypothetical protein DH86_00004229 [Scytalidium sp. 3C]
MSLDLEKQLTFYGAYHHNHVNVGIHMIFVPTILATSLLLFVGHGVFEGRAPALLDNLVQALVMAPFFVFLEILFKFGYRPELQARVEKNVLQQIEKFKSGKQGDQAAKAK